MQKAKLIAVFAVMVSINTCIIGGKTVPFHSLSAEVPGPPGPAGPGTFTEETSIVSVRDYGAIGDGVTGDRNAIYNAIAAANNRELLFPAGTYRVESDLTFSSTVAVRFLNGATLSIDSGVTVTINGPLEAGLYQIFSGDGSVNIGKWAVPMVYPQWWGAIGDGVADDTIAIQAAIDVVGAGGTVYLPPGTYKTTSGLTFPKQYASNLSQGVVLRGAGIGSTVLIYISATGYALEFATGFEETSRTVSYHTITDLRIEAPNTTGGGVRYEAGCLNKLENVIIQNIPNGNAIFMESNNMGSLSMGNRFNEVFIGNVNYAFYMKNDSQVFMHNCNIAYNVNSGIYAEGGIVWASQTQISCASEDAEALNMTGGNSTWNNGYFDRGKIRLDGGRHSFHSSYVGYIDWTNGTKVHIDEDCQTAYTNSPDVTHVPDEFTPLRIIAAVDSRNLLSGGATEVEDADASNGRCIQFDTQYAGLSIRFNSSFYRKTLPRGKYLVIIYAKGTSQVTDDFRIYYDVDNQAGHVADYTLTSDYQPYLYMVTVDAAAAGSSVAITMYKRTAAANAISVDYIEIRYLGPDVGITEMVLHNPSHSDADGSRVSRLQYWGEQSGGEISALAEIKVSHDGTADGQKGRIEIGVNSGNDGYSPTRRLSIDSDGRVDISGRLCTSTIISFASGDSSPSVSGGNIFKTANTGSTTITTFDDGVAGQMITVIVGDNNTAIDFTGTNLKGNGGTDWTPISGDHMTCVFDGNNWYCTVSNNTP